MWVCVRAGATDNERDREKNKEKEKEIEIKKKKWKNREILNSSVYESPTYTEASIYTSHRIHLTYACVRADLCISVRQWREASHAAGWAGTRVLGEPHRGSRHSVGKRKTFHGKGGASCTRGKEGHAQRRREALDGCWDISSVKKGMFTFENGVRFLPVYLFSYLL